MTREIQGILQTLSPAALQAYPSKVDLCAAFVNKQLNELRSPALVIDRAVIARNCSRMHERAQKHGLRFRAHVKTLKTIESTRMQLVSEKGTCDAIVCSTIPEIFGAMELVVEGILKDILYGVPIPVDRISELASIGDTLAAQNAVLRLLVDNITHVNALDAFSSKENVGRRWSVFVKVDGGGTRAGLPPKSSEMKDLLDTLFKSSSVDVYGFYCHNGSSYSSTTLDGCAEYLTGELAAANDAASTALSVLPVGLKTAQPWVLSVGSTPAAHAVSNAQIPSGLHGIIELHAGNYASTDLQQVSTSAVSLPDIAISVLTRVISVYPHRGEVLCDAAAIAMSKDTGPSGGYGSVVAPQSAVGWQLGRISQEHGTLVRTPGAAPGNQDALLVAGDVLRLVPQHACLTAAQHAWYYVVENGGDEVVDVWVPWKGW